MAPTCTLQMRDDGEIIDPLVHLRPYLIGPQATYRGQLIAAAMPGRWREARMRIRASRREHGQDSDGTDSERAGQDKSAAAASSGKDSHAGD